jgi:hypothetical protein
MDILDAVLGLVDAAWHAATAALIGRIHRHGDKAPPGQMLGIKARRLLLHAAVGVGNDNGCMAARRIIRRRRVDIGDDIDPAHLIGHRVDIDLAGLIACQCPVIDQREGVGAIVERRGDGVIGGLGKGLAHERASCHCGGDGKRGGSEKCAPVGMWKRVGHGVSSAIELLVREECQDQIGDLPVVEVGKQEMGARRLAAPCSITTGKCRACCGTW